MFNLFERRDPWGNSPAIWIVATMAFLAPFAWTALRQTRLENDVEKWLPADDPQLKILEESRTLFPSDDRIFVTWDGSSLNDPRIAKLVREFNGVVDRYGVKREGLKEIADVVDPNDVLRVMQENDVEPQEAARRLRGVLLGAGPLKVKLTDAGRDRLRKTRGDLGKAVRKAFQLRLDVTGPMEDVALLTQIPTPAEEGEDPPEPAMPAVLTPDGQLTTRDSLDHDLQLSWNGVAPGAELTLRMVEFLKAFRWQEDQKQNRDIPLIEDCFFVVGAPIALVVSLTDVGLADKAHTLDAIRDAAEKVGIPRQSLRLGGSIVASSALNQKVAEAAWNPAAPPTSLHRRSVFLASALVGAALSFVMVRSLRLSILILAAAIYASVISTALVPATGVAMNMVLAVMPTLLLVISLSGAIHVANYWKHAAASHPDNAVAATVRTAILPCALASVTTAIGLVSLCTSSLAPVRDFGLYAAIGTLISLLVVLYGLPSLLQLWPAPAPPRTELDRRGWRELGRFLMHRPSLAAFAFLAVCAASTAGLAFFQTETKVIRYFSDSSGIVADYRFLENQLAGIVPVEVLVRFDPSAQDEARFVERLELVRRVEEKLRGHPEISGCLSLADFQPVNDPPPSDAGFLTMTRYNKRSSMMEQRLRDGEIEGASAFYRQISAEPAVQASPHLLSSPGEELWRITAQVLVLSDADYGDILSDIDRIVREELRYRPGSQHVITGAVPLFLQTQQAVLHSLIRSFALAFVLVLGIFVVLLRSVWAGLVTMIPNVVPITVIFGLLGWCGARIDIGVMITASIALGIAVDGTLHFVTWFRNGLAEGRSRSESIIRALEHCGPAMWQTSTIVALGLLMLSPAELLLISRFGWLMSAMTGVALLADLVLLPLLLASPLGNLFQPPPDGTPPQSVHTGRSDVPPPHISAPELATSLRISGLDNPPHLSR